MAKVHHGFRPRSTKVKYQYVKEKYLYLILHKFWSVLKCDILGIGLLQMQYIYKGIIGSSVRTKTKSHKILLTWSKHGVCVMGAIE